MTHFFCRNQPSKAGIMAAAGLLAVASFVSPALAEKPKQVEITGPLPLPIDSVTIDALPPVELAPNQSVNLQRDEALPHQIIVRQAFADTNSSARLVSFSQDVILRTVTIAPGTVDTNPDLFNCSATLRWADRSQLHPNSTDRYLVSHNWGGSNQIALNYGFPYRVRLPAGMSLEAEVSRVGSDGYCQAVINVTGTVAD